MEAAAGLDHAAGLDSITQWPGRHGGEAHAPLADQARERLSQRLQACEDRLQRLELTCGIGVTTSRSTAKPEPQQAALDKQIAAGAEGQAEAAAQHPAEGTTVQRLSRELDQLGVQGYKFCRVPGDYYSRDLEYRRQCLGAASVEHLCKSIIMQNKAPHTEVDCERPANSKYFLVIVQYAAKLDADKIKAHMHARQSSKGVYAYKMKLVDEAVSAELTGFQHNAVSPVGIKTQLPIIISNRIAQLHPDFFWLGGGETDLKLGMHFADFEGSYRPIVLDCTAV